MPVLEIALFPGSDSYLADPTLLEPALDFLTRVEGWISTYTGVFLEDKKTVLLAIQWETYEHHKNLMERSDYPDLGALLKPSLGGKVSLQHVEFNRDVTNGLTSPTLEIVWFNAKPELSQIELMKMVDQLGNALAEAKGCHSPIGWGESQENPGRIVCAIGWDSYDAHIDALKEGTMAQVSPKLRAATIDLFMFHVQLKRYLP